MSWGTFSRHFKVNIWEIHSDRLAGEVLQELAQEFECHSIIFLQSSVISSFGLKFSRIKSVHITRDPKVSLDLEVKLRFSCKFLSYSCVKVIKKLGLAYFVTKHNAILRAHIVNSFRVSFISGSANESYVFFEICASELFEYKLKFSVILLLIHKLQTGLELECAEVLRWHSVFVYVYFWIDPESFGAWFYRLEGMSRTKCLTVVATKYDRIVPILKCLDSVSFQLLTVLEDNLNVLFGEWNTTFIWLRVESLNLVNGNLFVLNSKLWLMFNVLEPMLVPQPLWSIGCPDSHLTLGERESDNFDLLDSFHLLIYLIIYCILFDPP